MAVFPIFSSDFRYLEMENVTDVADIVTAFKTEAVDNGNWSRESTYLFKTAQDPMERSFQLQLSVLAASRLGITAIDQFGNTVAAREIDIDPGGCNVRLFTGPRHAFFTAVRGGTPEFGGAALLDLSPANILLPLYSLAACGHRRASDGGADHYYMDEWAMWDGAAAVNTFRVMTYTVGNPIGFSAKPGLAVAGANVYYPLRLVTRVFDKNRWVGRIPQCILGPDSLVAGAEVTVPIGDAGETGVFKECGRSVITNLKMLVREA